MKKIKKLLFLSLILPVFSLASCSEPASSNISSKESSSSTADNSNASSVVPVDPTGITLDKYQVAMVIDQEETITPAIAPADANYELEWSSSDTSVVVVENGVVKAISSGTANIIVKIKNTNYVDQCLVNVAAPFHDYVKDGSVKLGLDYKNHEFFTDGIEQVTLLTPIDGDTAHFKTGNGTTLKARFYGIDTPESTGKVQEWGVPASNFTKKKLQNADKNGTIVISSPQAEYGKPDPDSTGSRYVSLVWINEEKKNASLDELYLLNLWIVQEGLSMKKNVSDIKDYEASFDSAEAQAKVYKKNMWSGEKDELFNYDTGYLDVSLLDIKREVEKSIIDQSYKNPYDNMKVRFTGVVSSYSDGTLYVQEFYPKDDDHPEEGEWAGINIFCGMSEIPTKFTTPNTYLQVYGLCKDSETFGFQITDTQGKWKAYAAGEEDCKVLLKASENIDEHSLYTFHYTIAELNQAVKDNNCESLFCSVSVTGSLTCTSCYVSDDRALTLNFKESDFGVYIPYAYHGDQTDATTKVIRWDTEEQFLGKKFHITDGTYAWHRTTSGKVKYQIIPTNELSFVWENESN